MQPGDSSTPQVAVASRSWQLEPPEDLALVAAYQRQICDLEGKLSLLRLQVGELEGELSRSRAAHEHLANPFQGAPVGYLVLDEHGVIQEVNARAAQMVGYRRSSDVRGSLLQFLARDDVPRFLAHLRQCKTTRGEASIELALLSKASRWVPCELITLPVEEPAGRPIRQFRGVLLNNLRRHEAEKALAQTQRDFVYLVDTVQGIVWEADARTLDILFVSAFAERLLGYSAEQWRQADFWGNHIYVKDRERALNQVAQAVAHEKVVALEYRAVAADRRLVWLHDSIRVTRHGGHVKLLGVAVDITDRKQVQAQLEESERVLGQRVEERTAQLRETIGELESFSYTLSHDMRAPLRAMHGYSQILIQLFAEKLGDRGADYLHRIISSAERLDDLVQDVLKYSRVAREPLELKPVDVQRVLETLIQDLPALQPPKAEVDIRPPLPLVCAHPAFLTQCFSNLLSNAVKFVPPGTKPHISIWTEELPGTVSASELPSASSPVTESDLPRSAAPVPCPASRVPASAPIVRIWVQDNGIGISAENQKRIFGLFQRVNPSTEYEGSGIGLAIVQKAVERMGGRLGVESSLGQGSKFWLQLHRAEV